MPATVLLNDTVEALEIQFDESSSFLDLDTGQVETVCKDLLGEAEGSDEEPEPDLLDWQKDEWEVAKRIVSSDHFIGLPTKFDVHEWSIMEDFCDSVASDRIREDLQYAIHGADAFRHFKTSVRRYRVESNWFASG